MKTTIKRMNLYGVLFCASLCVIMLSACASTEKSSHAQSVVESVKAQSTTMVGSTSGVTLTALRSTDSNEWRESTIDFPVFEDAEALNEAIEQMISAQYNEFYQSSVANWKAMSETDSKNLDDMNAPVFSPHQFVLSWSFAQINTRYISLVFKVYSFTGGANGLQTVVSFNYDCAENKLLTLKEILNPTEAHWLDAFAAEVRTALETQLNVGDDKILKSMVAAGTQPTESNFSAFTFDDYTITVYFQKYQVAPGYFGIQSIDMPRPLPAAPSNSKNF